jgi:hypothetical protein
MRLMELADACRDAGVARLRHGDSRHQPWRRWWRQRRKSPRGRGRRVPRNGRPHPKLPALAVELQRRVHPFQRLLHRRRLRVRRRRMHGRSVPMPRRSAVRGHGLRRHRLRGVHGRSGVHGARRPLHAGRVHVRRLRRVRLGPDVHDVGVRLSFGSEVVQRALHPCRLLLRRLGLRLRRGRVRGGAVSLPRPAVLQRGGLQFERMRQLHARRGVQPQREPMRDRGMQLQRWPGMCEPGHLHRQRLRDVRSRRLREHGRRSGRSAESRREARLAGGD